MASRLHGSSAPTPLLSVTSKVGCTHRCALACGADKVKHLSVDLKEAPVEVLQQLSSGGANDVTHIFYTAFIGERFATGRKPTSWVVFTSIWPSNYVVDFVNGDFHAHKLSVSS